jgi:hypothetical protein
MSSRKNKFTRIFLFGLFGLVAVGTIVTILLFNNIDQLLYSPYISPEMWCDEEPCHPISIFGSNFILIQPLSTVIVYLLGIITIIIGIFILIRREHQKSRTWWGIALIFWGVGTLLAGTSYQAFGYELKCEGNLLCTWTSVFEIFYLFMTVYSVNAMMMSQVYSSSTGAWKKFQLWYAPINAVLYSIILLVGSIVPIRFLISFELMVLFVIPSMLMFFVNNIIQFARVKDRQELMLIFVWVGMALVMTAYYTAVLLNLTETMWNRGIWFSDNDVLHIGLIIWMIYVGFTVRTSVRDLHMKTK